MSVVVSDTSPLLYLARLGRLDVARELYGTVRIPTIVWDELVTYKPHAMGVPSLIGADFLRIVSEPRDVAASLTERYALDPGESGALALALELDAVVILDDYRARRTARLLKLEVVGLVGVLTEARRCGLIERLSPVLDELVLLGFRVKAEVLHRALVEVGEAT